MYNYVDVGYTNLCERPVFPFFVTPTCDNFHPDFEKSIICQISHFARVGHFIFDIRKINDEIDFISFKFALFGDSDILAIWVFYVKCYFSKKRLKESQY